MAGKTGKNLELKKVDKNLASKTLREVGNDLKKFTSSTTSSMGGVNTAFTRITSGFSKLGSGLKGVGSASLSVFSGMASGAGRALDAIFSLKTLIMGLFAGIVAKGIGAFVGLNAEFEKMKVTLDVLTKGQGEAWFNKLNRWALDMPVSMAEVTKSFITMQAYGLTPTIKMMENLVNVAAILPESGRAMTGIARALGQIQTKGRLEGQELRQLAEWAVPGYEAVYKKIFKKISEETGQSVHDLKFTMIDAATANKALLETMEEHFGGAAKAIAKTWGGLWTRLGNYAKEFFRQIGESGGMAPFRAQLENIVNFMKKAFESGEMQKATSLIGSSFSIVFDNLVKYFQSSKVDIKNWADVFISVLEKIIYAVTIFVQTLAGIKLILLGIKFTWAGVAIIINTGLFGIFWLVNKVIAAFKFLIDSLPSSIPGVSAIQEAFSSFADITGEVQESLGDSITIAGQIAYTTGEQIAKTGDNIANRWKLADKVITDLRANLAKHKVTEAVPPSGKEPTGANIEELSEYEREREAILNSVIGQEKGWGKEWMKDMETSIIENASAWQQVRYAYLAYEKEGLKGSTFKRFQKVFEDFTDSLKTGYASAIAGMIQGTMNFAEAVSAMGDTIYASFVNIFADLVAEWLATQTKMLLAHIFFQKEVTAATLAGEVERVAITTWGTIKQVAIEAWGTLKVIAMKAYEAAAKVFAALAGMGPWGIVLGVAGAAAAIAIVMAFAGKIQSFEKGTGLEGVKEDGPAMLHAGEIVLNRKQSDSLRENGSVGGGVQPASTNVNLSFTIQSFDSEDMERVVRKKIIPMIQSNIKDFGRGRTMVKEAR